MQNNNPLVSIITVCLNSEDTIADTMLSSVNQKYSNVEYILMDGLSKDHTMAIANSFKEKFLAKKFKFISISEKDKGIYDAMNKAIIKAKGDWLIFMNSGDTFFDDQVLAKVFSNNISEDTMVVYGDTIAKNSKSLIYSPKKIQNSFFFSDTICHQSIFFKKEAFQKVGLFSLNYKIISDRHWLLKASMQNLAFEYISGAISIWDEEGFSKNNIPIYIKEVSDLKRTYFTRIENIVYTLRRYALNKVETFINKFKKRI